jgi:hypothetical protein
LTQFADFQTKAVIQHIQQSMTVPITRNQEPFDLALGEFLPRSDCHVYRLLYIVSFTGLQHPLPSLVSIALRSVLNQMMQQFSMEKAYVTGLRFTLNTLIAPLFSSDLISFLVQLSTKMMSASTVLKDWTCDQEVLFELIVDCCKHMNKSHVQEYVDCLLKEGSEQIVLLDLCCRLVTREGSCITGIVERARGMKSSIAAYLLMDVYAIRSGSSCVVSL